MDKISSTASDRLPLTEKASDPDFRRAADGKRPAPNLDAAVLDGGLKQPPDQPLGRSVGGPIPRSIVLERLPPFRGGQGQQVYEDFQPNAGDPLTPGLTPPVLRRRASADALRPGREAWPTPVDHGFRPPAVGAVTSGKARTRADIVAYDPSKPVRAEAPRPTNAAKLAASDRGDFRSREQAIAYLALDPSVIATLETADLASAGLAYESIVAGHRVEAIRRKASSDETRILNPYSIKPQSERPAAEDIPDLAPFVHLEKLIIGMISSVRMGEGARAVRQGLRRMGGRPEAPRFLTAGRHAISDDPLVIAQLPSQVNYMKARVAILKKSLAAFEGEIGERKSKGGFEHLLDPGRSRSGRDQAKIIAGVIADLETSIAEKEKRIDETWHALPADQRDDRYNDDLVEKRGDIGRAIPLNGGDIGSGGEAALEAQLVVALHALHVLVERLSGFRDEMGRLDPSAWAMGNAEFKALRADVQTICRDPIAKKARLRHLKAVYRDQQSRDRARAEASRARQGRTGPTEPSARPLADLGDQLEANAKRRNGKGAFRRSDLVPGKLTSDIDRSAPSDGLVHTDSNAMKIGDADGLKFYNAMKYRKGKDAQGKEVRLDAFEEKNPGDFRVHLAGQFDKDYNVNPDKTGLVFAPWDPDLQEWHRAMLDVVDHPAFRLFQAGHIEQAIKTVTGRRDMRERQEDLSARPTIQGARDVLKDIQSCMDTGVHLSAAYDKKKKDIEAKVWRFLPMTNAATGHQQAAGTRGLQKKLVAFLSPAAFFGAVRNLLAFGI